jgi:hypothetical protein
VLRAAFCSADLQVGILGFVTPAKYLHPLLLHRIKVMGTATGRARMACAFLYSDRTGREVFRITDPAEQLPTPSVGETIEFSDHHYMVESVKMVWSSSPASLATEYRVRVLLIE